MEFQERTEAKGFNDCFKCGAVFDTEHGLAVHKGKMHPPSWLQRLLNKIFK